MVINKIVGIIGWPISHSLSPIMQNHAFKEAGLASWQYIPLEVSPNPSCRLREAILGLRALGFQGANVTVPYKESVLPYLDHIDNVAKMIGAVNTITIDKDGLLIGYNTDALGFINDLLEHQVNVKYLKVLLLGAGGAARAIVYGLLSHGCKHITILNRTKNKADDIAKSFRDLFSDANIEIDILSKDSMANVTADLIINTTSVGLKNAEEMPWDEGISFSDKQCVYDIIYNPSMTKLLRHAAKNGAKVINGLGMLVHQGALAFKIWTGHDAPIKSMKQLLIRRAP